MRLISLFVLASALICSEAFAGSRYSQGYYGQVSVYGVSLVEDSVDYNDGTQLDLNNDIGVGAGGAIGYKFWDYFRVEGEAAYRYNQVEAVGIDGDFSSIALMGNGYVDVPTGTSFTPYVGAGVGYAYDRNGCCINDSTVSDHTLAYQGMAGISYALSKKSALVMGYKYFATSTPEYDGRLTFTAESPYKTHNVEFGIRGAF